MKDRHGGEIYGDRNVKLDFSVNMNPSGMPEEIRRAAEKAVAVSDRYPDSQCRKLRALMEAHYGIPGEDILFGNGAAELIYSVVRAVKPRRAVLTAPSFLEYREALLNEGTELCYFFLREEDGFRLDAEAYLDFLREKRPQMIFLCNPSNPVGNLMEKETLLSILSYCEKEKIFAVVDECFLEFTPEPEKATVLSEVLRGNDFLMVLSAPTKIFAMAGLRLGYGFLSGKEIREKIRASLQPWNVSIPAQAAGEASFGAFREEFIRDTRSFLNTERQFMTEEMRKLGFTVYDSSCDFLLFRDLPGKEPERLFHDLLKEGILIRCCANYVGLNGTFYRISIHKHQENETFLHTIRTYIG